MKIQPLVLAAFALTSLLQAQPGADPFRASPPAAPAAPEPAPEGPVMISICYETFSLPLAAAAKLQREIASDADFYRQLAASVGKDEVRQESFAMVRCPSGYKATVESISEQIYPTEFEEPEMPQSLGVAVTPVPPKTETQPAKEGEKPKETPEPPKPQEVAAVDVSKLAGAPAATSLAGIAPPVTPTAFETRNTGFTLEVEPVLSEDHRIIDLRFVPEFVTLVGRSTFGQGASTTETPVFESQRINTSITLRPGVPGLTGTVSRPPVSKVDPDSANRVWFAFVTATLVKP